MSTPKTGTQNPHLKTQSFGIEIEFTSIARETAAGAIAQALGVQFIPAGFGDTHRVLDSRGRTWKVEPDGSVNGSRSNRGGEFVSPILGWDDIATLQEVVRSLRAAGAKADASCGIHIHVDGRSLDAEAVRHLTAWFAGRSRAIYKALGVLPNRVSSWAKHLPECLLNSFKVKGTIDSLEASWYRHLSSQSGQWCRRNHSRYHGLNLHSLWYRGTVEFRMFNSTLHAGEVRAYVVLALAMVGRAKTLSEQGKRVTFRACADDSYILWQGLRDLGIFGEVEEFKNVRQHLLKRVETSAQRARRLAQAA